VKSAAKDPDAYVREAPEERRPHLETLRRLVKTSVPRATEAMAWGMIGFALDGRPFAALASQKTTLSLYLMDLYSQAALREKHAASLVGLKMGKSCINFRSVDELPLAAIAAILKEAPRVVVTGGTMAKLPEAKTGKTKAWTTKTKTKTKAKSAARKRSR
jgi:uncharacterized protein YdhG (YjbR/CyaY superfamily)